MGRNLYISNVAYHIDGVELAETATADNKYPLDEWRRTGQVSAAVSPSSRFRTDLALLAAEKCLQERPKMDNLLVSFHCVAFESGIRVWSSASYINNALSLTPTIAAEINAASNGALVAMDLASAYLTNATEHAQALITTADVWRLPSIDRWQTDKGLVFGDTGTALVLSTWPGSFRLVALSSRTDPRWEALHRGDPSQLREVNVPEEREPDVAIDLRSRAREFLSSGASRDEFLHANSVGITAVFQECLHRSRLSKKEIAWFVLPFFGINLTQAQCAKALDIDLDQTTASFGLTLGHTGAGDQIAGLRHLVDSDRLRAGDHIALIGVGAGFTWSAAVVQYAGNRTRPSIVNEER